jgi:hypothetical protein
MIDSDRKILIKEAEDVLDKGLVITFEQYYRLMLEMQIEIMKKQDKWICNG